MAQKKKLVLPSVGRRFLLNWTFVLKVILKDLTLISADMFGQYSLSLDCVDSVDNGELMGLLWDMDMQFRLVTSLHSLCTLAVYFLFFFIFIFELF